MCGLSGYNGRPKPSAAAIKLLGIYNRKRGTDSFGIMWDGKVHKSVYNWEKKSEGDAYEFLYGTSFTKIKNDPNVLMHNRARSVGAITLANTHPFEYETDRGKFVFAHNGTIKNIEELALEYGYRHPFASTDSETLGYLIVHNGWEVLAKYIGAAAFSLYEVNTRTLYLWRGESQQDSAMVTDERPLYYWQGREALYYSSEPEPLVTALDTKENIFELDANIVYKIQMGVIVEETPVSRAGIIYKAPVYHQHDPTAGYNYSRTANPPKNLTTAWSTSYAEELNPQYFAKEKAYFWKGYHWRNGHKLAGEWKINDDGKFLIGSVDPVFATEFKQYWFYQGHMLKDEESFKWCVEQQIDMDAKTGQEVIKLLHPKTILIRKYTNVANLYVNDQGENAASNIVVDIVPRIPLFGYYSYRSQSACVHPKWLSDDNIEEADYEPVGESLQDFIEGGKKKRERRPKKASKLKLINITTGEEEDSVFTKSGKARRFFGR